MDKIWYLLKGQKKIAKMVVENVDQPWIYCSFTPLNGFREVEQYFTQLASLQNQERYEEVYDQIRKIWDLDLTISSSAIVLDKIILHISNGKAHFRGRRHENTNDTVK